MFGLSKKREVRPPTRQGVAYRLKGDDRWQVVWCRWQNYGVFFPEFNHVGDQLKITEVGYPDGGNVIWSDLAAILGVAEAHKAFQVLNEPWEFVGRESPTESAEGP